MLPSKYDIFVVFIAFIISNTKAQDEDLIPFEETLIANASHIIFNPDKLMKIRDGVTRFVQWQTDLEGAHHASYVVLNNRSAEVSDFVFEVHRRRRDGNVTMSGSFNITALFIGYTGINVTVYDAQNNVLDIGRMPMSVLLAYQKMNEIFTYILTFLVSCIYINMGASIDLEVVKRIAKRPIGPAVGIACQYIIMPLLAFGLAKLFFPGDPLRQLGLFLNGASPGGGNSNMWTFLMGGSLDLSIMMTFTSTIFAFGAVPLWVLTLGPVLVGRDSEFVIPYSNIATLVALLVIPCAAGVLLQKKLPKIATFLHKRVLAPLSIFNIIFIFTFGFYTHRYVIALFNWKILLAGFALPGLGYLSGFVISYLFKRPWQDIIAITIETGLQNANIAIIILKFTLEQPAGDLAVVIPAYCVLMTPLILLVALFVKKSYGFLAHKGGIDFIARRNPFAKTKHAKDTVQNGHINEIILPEEDTYPKTDMATSRDPQGGRENPNVDLKDESV